MRIGDHAEIAALNTPDASVRTMCPCLRIRASGFYAWLKNPLSNRAKEDARQTELVRQVVFGEK